MTSIITEIGPGFHLGAHPGSSFVGEVPPVDLWEVAAGNENPADSAPALVAMAPAIFHLPLRDDVRELESSSTRRLVRATSGMVAEALRSRLAVLVTCSRGLNRSALVAALALVRLGHDPKDVVVGLRDARSRLVLSNRGYERYVLSQ